MPGNHVSCPGSSSWSWLALLACASAACGGGGGGGSSAPAPAGTFRPKPEGGHYFADAHASGRASRLALVEILWGRLVDVHAIDANGETLSEPVLRDFVIGENVQNEPDDYVLETSPISQKSRLVVRRVLGEPDRGSGTFEALAQRASLGLVGVFPKSESVTDGRPFSFVARNAVLMLRFDDLLDDDEASVPELAQWVRVLSGYPPTTPTAPRILFDPNHGGVAGGRFHSTRLLIDVTVSETEAADSPVPLQLNSLGLPRSERMTQAANVSLRLPTRADPGSGQFSVLHNLSGGALDAAGSRPFDEASPTLELVRALRAGNVDDPNNGFLLDFGLPRVVGSWPCAVLDAERAASGGFDWRLVVAFTTSCSKAPEPGDLVAVGERLLEVTAPAPGPDDSGRVTVRARVLNTGAPQRAELLGLGTYQTLFRSGLGVDRGCWLRFTPGPREYPSTGVSSTALTTIRFSEPIDPDSALPFDTLVTVRGNETSAVTTTSLIVGRLRPSLDLRELVFLPSLPYPHQGDNPTYHVRIPGAGGVTDLAGNELSEGLPGIEFTIDPASPRANHSSFVLRFDSPDELEPIGFPDLRGQFIYQFDRGTIRPREADFGSRPVDRSNPIVSIMTSFAPGVATPISPLGSKLQAVWRYADLGWSIRDESKYNLDVVGLSWSPARGQVASDFYEQFEILLSHSNKLPDEQRRAPITGGMKYPLSGLWDGPIPFARNVLDDPESPQVVLHPRALGYRIDPIDISFSTSGLPIMPWPINRTGGELVSFTWRDTAALARGGDFGAGVPLDSEVGFPLNLENNIGSFAGPGVVPTVGLPLLMEFRCFPSQTGIGLNPLAINLATAFSATPNHRAYSTGGFNAQGQRVNKNPDFELAPTGGFNPNSRPPGRPTARNADNALYLGQLDYVIRVSRTHTIWVDTNSTRTRFAAPVLEPGDEARPPGTRILVDFRGAERFDDAGERPFNSRNLTAYGDPNAGSTVFHRGDPTWKRELAALDGARYVQMRFSFVNNIEAGLVAELSAVGIAYELE